MRSMLLFTASLAAAFLAGCGGMSPGTTTVVSTPIAALGPHGTVHGGQQPIVDAVIQLWQAGTSDYGTGATPLISTVVTTDVHGNFNISGLYHCTPGSMVYMTATGGQPTANTPNSAADQMTGLGLCDNLPSATFIFIDEVTTAATVWALAPFMKGTNIGAPGSNVSGLVNAFADVNTLVDTAAGTARASTASITLPTAEINMLANILAGCVNTNGPGSAGCSNLFLNAPNTDGTKPTDEIQAALNIARNPARNVANLITNQGTNPPFGPSLTSAPDLTLAVTYTGNGINSPTALAIDASNNVWIANSVGNSVTELSHTGANVGSSPYSGNGISAPTALSIDAVGHIWIANSTNTLTEISSSGTLVGNAPYSGGGLSSPTAIAFDGLGNAWIANSASSTVSEFSSSGSVLSGTGFTNAAIGPAIGIAIATH